LAEKLTEEIHKIERDIELSGFPLEIEVTAVLRKNGWHVRNQVYYLDKNEEKPRSVDIVAYKNFFQTFGAHDRLIISLVIECKKSEKPWVFFTSSKKEQPLFELPLFLVKHFAIPKLDYSLKFTEWTQKQMHYTPSALSECAIISYEPYKKGKGREILRATYQVTKALNYLEEFFMKDVTLDPMKPVFILYPVIVFDGRIFEYKLENEDLKLSPTNYVQYFVEREKFFLIDVIEKNFIPEYLKKIDEEIESLKKALK
jgi:hypothetical protein